MSFFVRQLDFVSCLCGLGFFLLGSSMYLLLYKARSRFPWKPFGWFCLLHGIHEWLELVQLSAPDSPVLHLLNPVFLGLSLYCLFDFGVQGIGSVYRQPVPPGVLVPFFLAAFSWVFMGFHVLPITFRYFFALPGSFLGALALWRYSDQDHARSPALTAAAMGLAVFGILAGVIVPEGPFFPASVFHQEAFFSMTGIPIQVFRAVTAIFLALCFYYHFEIIPEKNPPHPKRSFSANPLPLPLLSIGCLLFFGWAMTEMTSNMRIRDEHNRIEGLGRLADQTGLARFFPPVLSREVLIGPALRRALFKPLTGFQEAFDAIGVVSLYLPDHHHTRFTCKSRTTGSRDGLVGIHMGTPTPDLEQALTKSAPQTLMTKAFEDSSGPFTVIFPLRKGAQSQNSILFVLEPGRKTWDIMVRRYRLIPISFTLLLILLMMAFFTNHRNLQLGAQELSDSEKRYRSLFEENSAIMFLVSPETGSVVQANNSACKYFEYSRTEMLDTTIGDLFTMETASALRIFTGMGQSSRKNIVLKSKHHTEEVRHVEVHVVSTPYRDDQVLYFIIQDITEKKRAEQALIESEERYRLLVNQLREGIMVYDSHGIITFVNPRLAEMLCCHPSELLGAAVLSLFPEPLIPLMVKKMEERKAGTASQYEITMPRRNGQMVHVLISASPLHDRNGATIGVLALVTDISERKIQDQELRKWGDVFNNTMMGIVITKPEGEILDLCNPAFAAIHGYLEEDLRGKSVHTVFAPSSHAALQRVRQELLLSGQIAFEAEHIRKDGTVFPVFHTVNIVKDEQGIPLYRIINIQDLTDQKRAERILRESEERYRLLAENISDLVWSTDLDLHLTYVGPSFSRLFGFPFDPEKPIAMADYLDPESRGKVNELHTFYHEQIIRGEEFNLDFCVTVQLVHLREGGGSFWGETRATLSRDKSGAIIGIQGVTRDISERKMAEFALKRQQQQIQRVTDNIQDVVLELDSSGTLLFITPSSHHILEIAPDKVLYQPISQLFPQISEERFAEICRQTRDQRSSTFEFSYDFSGGEKRFLEIVTTVNQSDSTELLSYVWTCRDMTLRRRSEEMKIAKETAEAASQTKSEFLANMSHEIRTPMNAVLGFSELLRKTDLSTQQRDYLETSLQAAKNLMRIIDDILDYSKMEAGKLALDPYPFQFGDVLDEVKTLFTAKAREKNLELRLRVAPHLYYHTCYGDADRIRQIFQNLVSNAIKFTNAGSILIAATCGPPQDQLLPCCIRVEDTGIGIPPEAMDKLFQKFSQADSSTTRKFGGTGLGLAISKNLLEMMGGQILVAARPEGGTRFTVELLMPLNAHAATGPDLAPEARSTALTDLRGRAVLVIEDDSNNRQLVAEWLREANAETVFALDGLEAEKHLTSRRWDIVLMDCQIPDKDGFQLTREARTPGHLNQNTPILAVTALALDQDKEKCFAAGMDDHVAKPIQSQELFQKIRRLLGIIA